jgi:predicted HicB family RNase H-like nuclease
VITVRLPKSLHESLRAEAHDRRTSMNKLCISKLLQVIDDELVPAEMAASEEPAA